MIRWMNHVNVDTTKLFDMMVVTALSSMMTKIR